ncbi:MAG: hypothetical protein OK474_12690 [Thaumarchaeota archaeon]|nr:hypothetical protein [Nitrososphaerota archaeon]
MAPARFPREGIQDEGEETQERNDEKRIDTLGIYGEPLAWERMGDVRWISGFASIHGHAVVVLPLDGEPSLIINGSFHGEPMHSYAWMTWIHDIRPVAGGYGLSKLSEEIASVLGRRGSNADSLETSCCFGD